MRLPGWCNVVSIQYDVLCDLLLRRASCVILASEMKLGWTTQTQANTFLMQSLILISYRNPFIIHLSKQISIGFLEVKSFKRKNNYKYQQYRLKLKMI